MSKPRQIPTLRIEGQGPFRVTATSYGREAPSGLGEFATRAEAEQAMGRLEDHLEHQRAKKEPSKAKVRRSGDT